jgi:AP-1 complex subunit gamma-1
LNAIKGVVVKRETPAAEDDIFGVSGGGGGTENVSDTVRAAAKEALARMPVVDIKLVQKKREERSGAIIEGGAMDPLDGGHSAPAASGGGDSLLDLADIFGGGTPAPAAPSQNGNSSFAAPAPAAAQSDVDLLSDIFSAPAAPVQTPMAPVSGGFDIFSQPAQTTPAPMVNDLFGANPAAPPAPPIGSPVMEVFGASPAQPSPMQPQQMSVPTPAAVGGPTPTEATIVPGFTHQGLTVEFECTKPDTWNKQNSLLVAKFINTTDAPLYGLHLQVAVPKYVTMEMKPPTSSTVPVTGGSSTKQVTQTISVTNTMLGTKNLMLKLKASFTSKGTKVEHMATCSGFPAGQY